MIILKRFLLLNFISLFFFQNCALPILESLSHHIDENNYYHPENLKINKIYQTEKDFLFEFIDKKGNSFFLFHFERTKVKAIQIAKHYNSNGDIVESKFYELKELGYDSFDISSLKEKKYAEFSFDKKKFIFFPQKLFFYPKKLKSKKTHQFEGRIEELKIFKAYESEDRLKFDSINTLDSNKIESILICYVEDFDEYRKDRCDKKQKNRFTEVKLLELEKNQITFIFENEKKYIELENLPLRKDENEVHTIIPNFVVENKTNFRKLMYVLYPLLFPVDVVISAPSFLLHSFFAIMWVIYKK